MYFLISPVLDPFENLYLEAQLLAQAARLGPTLMLWRSKPAVIIGKNQVPWRECDPAALSRRGVAFARRLTGGGAVYHDEGNLNYAFFSGRNLFDTTRQADCVRQALALLNIEACYDGRSSLTVSGKKVSGTAYGYKRVGALHHGTLLVHADLPALRRALKPAFEHIETKAIASVPSPVANVCDFRPNLNLSEVIEALKQVFSAEYGSCTSLEMNELALAGSDSALSDLEGLSLSEWHSDAWLYERTPAFSVRLETPAGLLRLRVVKGIVEEGTGPEASPLVGQSFAQIAPVLSEMNGA